MFFASLNEINIFSQSQFPKYFFPFRDRVQCALRYFFLLLSHLARIQDFYLLSICFLPSTSLKTVLLILLFFRSISFISFPSMIVLRSDIDPSFYLSLTAAFVTTLSANLLDLISYQLCANNTMCSWVNRSVICRKNAFQLLSAELDLLGWWRKACGIDHQIPRLGGYKLPC